MRSTYLFLLAMLTLGVGCLPLADEAKKASAEHAEYDAVPFTDIWAMSFVSPGSVSDGWAQGRQLPQRKLKVMAPTPQTWFHAARVNYVNHADQVYSMSAITEMPIDIPGWGLDTTVYPSPCGFTAAFDSYPSRVGYKMWNRRDNGKLPIIRPSSFAYVWNEQEGKLVKCGVYAPGDTLIVRVDVASDELSVIKYWIDEP